jgi:hypothetical protein
MRLRHGVWWPAGTWPGLRGTPRACRRLAWPDATSQGKDHGTGAVSSAVVEASRYSPVGMISVGRDGDVARRQQDVGGRPAYLAFGRRQPTLPFPSTPRGVL